MSKDPEMYVLLLLLCNMFDYAPNRYFHLLPLIAVFLFPPAFLHPASDPNPLFIANHLSDK